MRVSFLEIPEEAFESLPMSSSKGMHELTETIDRKTDIRSCKGAILKCTNKASICGGVWKRLTIM